MTGKFFTRRIWFLVAVVLLLIAAAGCSGSAPPVRQASSPKSLPDLEVYFPRSGQDPALVLADLYGSSKKNLDIAAYSLTHPQIVKAIADAHRRGVQVRIITDAGEAKNDSQKHALNTLRLAGIPVKVNTHSGLMHLKMSIVDDQAATTGSYNYTRSASDKNDEMFVVVRDAAFVKACRNEFEKMWTDNRNFSFLE